MVTKTRIEVEVKAVKWVTIEVADRHNLTDEEKADAVRGFDLGYEADVYVEDELYERPPYVPERKR